MRRLPRVLALLSIIASASAGAQLTAPVRNGQNAEIVVTGSLPGAAKVDMSDWRMAETEHVIVFSKGPESKLVETAHNLEKLHFVLSVLLNRVEKPDETIKLRVTMIGDSSDFVQLELGSVRWQEGPYPRAFPVQAYYDPREDGSVAATPGNAVKIMLQPPLIGMAKPNCETDLAGEVNPHYNGTLASIPIGEVSLCRQPEGRMYALFAQNYLMTYFPAAYPRWFLQGFGEIFSTMVAKPDGAIEYGHPPTDFRKVMEYYGRYPLDKVFRGDYLKLKDGPYDWTPYHAWALTHLLFFSEKWKAPLQSYLRDVARGRGSDGLPIAFGELKDLRSELSTYRGRKVPFERMTFPADRAKPPVIRRLSKSEAGIVRGKLEMGARTIFADQATGAAPSKATSRSSNWLERLRRDAERYPSELSAQLVLAEAECRSTHGEQCRAAADQALRIVPNDPSALLWKGVAEAQLAVAGPASERDRRLKEARALIVRSNRLDPDGLLPLLAYYRSYASSGERPTETAVAGLIKAVEAVPAATEPRPLLGRELLRLSNPAETRRAVLPVARGAFDTPEKKEAETLLRQAEAQLQNE